MTAADRKELSEKWEGVGEDCLRAAGALLREGHFRSSVSRSYYAAYAFVAGQLVDEPSFSLPEDRDGPSHALPALIGAHLSQKLGRGAVKLLRSKVGGLYDARIDSDYFPRSNITREMALEAVQDAAFIQGALQGTPRT